MTIKEKIKSNAEKLKISEPLTKNQKIAFAIIAIALVLGTIGLIVFFAKGPAPLPAEDETTTLLNNELNKINEFNTTELENLLKMTLGS